MHDVFISYSSKDLDITEQVRRILETNGISCWIAPRNIPSGSSYAAEIPAAIRGCTVFLLIGSLNAENSPWIRKELERAIIERKKIIPLMVEDVAFHDEFDFLLSLHQRYAAYEKTAEVMERLVKDIRTILGIPAPVQQTKAALPPIPNLRFDGFYIYAHPATQGFRTYYRFFPDGVVVSANTAAAPVDVVKWLDETQNHGSKITVENGNVWMTEVMGTGDTHRSKLMFEASCLLKEGYDYRALKNVTKKCDFLSFDDIAAKNSFAVRYDGLYVSKETNGFRSYYRFFPDGMVVSSYSSLPPVQAKQGLVKSKYRGSKLSNENGTLWLNEVWKSGDTYRAKVILKDNALTLEGKIGSSQKTLIKECTFLSFDDIAKPATAQTPALRFDGFYIASPEGDFRPYYRFYPNGLMVSAVTCATPAQAYEWLNETQNEGGKFVTQNGELWMTEPLSDGHSYHAQLTVEGDKLFMEGYNSWAKQNVKKECSFLAFADISKPITIPRFDGFYISPQNKGFRSYYRFYPDGMVVSSYTAASPAKAKGWLNESKYDGSRYAEENGELWMTETLSSGNTYHAKLTVNASGLLIEGYNSYSKKNVTKECEFLAFDDITP